MLSARDIPTSRMPSSQTDLFYRLTPDEIIDAVIKLGLEPSGHISQLNSMENRVFDLRLEDGSHIVTKFYRPGRWSREQILEEHHFLFALTGNDVPVLAPLRFDEQSLFEEQGIFFALWPRTGGREPEELNTIDLQILGRLVARLHNTGAAGEMHYRPAFSAERYLAEPLRSLQEGNFLQAGFRAEYEELVALLADEWRNRSANHPYQRIHGDLHKGNMLHGSEGWFLLDFDDSLTGPPLQDVWMMFSGRPQHERDVFLDAYREFRDFDERWLADAEILRAMRIVHYSGWIARRYDDPAFRSAFPDFASDAYWEEEIRILREIIGTLKGYTAEDAQPLSNKDFFFDYDD